MLLTIKAMLFAILITVALALDGRLGELEGRTFRSMVKDIEREITEDLAHN